MVTISAEILREMYAQDMKRFDEVLLRRALQYEKMTEKDLFSMPEEEQARHAALCKRLAEEILVMNRMKEIVEEVIASQREAVLLDEAEKAATDTNRFVTYYLRSIEENAKTWKILMPLITQQLPASI